MISRSYREKMDGLKLRLGRFDQNTEYVLDRSSCCYPVDPGTRVSYYMTRLGAIASTDQTGNFIEIPRFEIGVAADYGRSDDPRLVENLLSTIELEIFVMIKKILKENDGVWRYVRVSVGHIQFFDETDRDGLYGWAEVGIAVFKKSDMKSECKV